MLSVVLVLFWSVAHMPYSCHALAACLAVSPRADLSKMTCRKLRGRLLPPAFSGVRET